MVFLVVDVSPSMLGLLGGEFLLFVIINAPSRLAENQPSHKASATPKQHKVVMALDVAPLIL